MPKPRVFMHKKGFYDIEDFFAVLVYTLILFLFLVLLSLPMCSTKRNIELKSASEKIDVLNSDQLVIEMLRTQLPDDLPKLIESQKGKKFLAKATVHQGLAEATPTTYETEENVDIYDGVNVDRAISTLSNPSFYYLYKGKTYGEFVDNLNFGVPKKEQSNLFAVVTRAVFLKNAYPPHIIKVKSSLKDFYTYPEVYVKYASAGKFKAGDADLANPTPETKSVKPGFGTVSLSNPKIGESFATIPLTDKSNKPATASIMIVIRESRK